MKLRRKLTATICGLALFGAVAGIGAYNATTPINHSYIAADANQNEPDQAPSQQQADNVIAPIKGKLGNDIHWNGHGAYTIGQGENGTSNLNADVSSAPWANNGPLNQQGQATKGDALVNHASYQGLPRDQTGNGGDSWKPNGKRQQKTNQGQGWLYNNGHLLGYAIIGNIKGFDASENNHSNIVPETEWANQAGDPDSTGQKYYEMMVVNAIKDGNPTIRYQVEALYNSSELVPRAIHMQAKAKDNSVNFNVVIPNAQGGYNINYQTGEAQPGNGQASNQSQNQQQQQPAQQNNQQAANNQAQQQANKPTPTLPGTGHVGVFSQLMQNLHNLFTK